jgi:hypothetical protein
MRSLVIPAKLNGHAASPGRSCTVRGTVQPFNGIPLLMQCQSGTPAVAGVTVL